MPHVRYPRLFMHVRSYAVATEYLYERETRTVKRAFNRVGNVADTISGTRSLNARIERAFSNFHKLLRCLIHVSDSDRNSGVRDKALMYETEVERHDIAILENARRFVWNAMHYLLVYRYAQCRRVRAHGALWRVAEKRRLVASFAYKLFRKLVQGCSRYANLCRLPHLLKYYAESAA